MTLVLNESDWDELHQQAPITCPNPIALEDFEELIGMPEILGRGYNRILELSPGMWLNFSERQYTQDCIHKVSEHEHPIQISVFPSGRLYFNEVHPNLGGDRSYFSGSGMSPAVAEIYRAGEHLTCVNIEIDPHLFNSVLLSDQPSPETWKPLFKGEEWKVAFYPEVTPAIRAITQQMWHTPYCGSLKRLYLQAKVMELLVLYLDGIANPPASTAILSLKPDSVDYLHQAKAILDRRLADPPSVVELAQQVGVSQRTLQRGFQMLFQTTVTGYLRQQRLEQAKRLLRQGSHTVTEVGTLVGYGNMGHFAGAFKRQFGIPPSQCLASKLSHFE